jgi:hypothetical protein
MPRVPTRSITSGRLETAKHLASWACVWPGTEESRGEALEGQDQERERVVAPRIVRGGLGSSRAKGTYYRSLFQTLHRPGAVASAP